MKDNNDKTQLLDYALEEITMIVSVKLNKSY